MKYVSNATRDQMGTFVEIGKASLNIAKFKYNNFENKTLYLKCTPNDYVDFGDKECYVELGLMGTPLDQNKKKAKAIKEELKFVGKEDFKYDA